MIQATSQRITPLLVDIGGAPTEKQLAIPAACTHSIVLYKTIQEQEDWQAKLQRCGVQALAELQSSLTEEDAQWSRPGEIPLRARVGGLERLLDKRRKRLPFELRKVVQTLFHYTGDDLREYHLQGAPGTVWDERELREAAAPGLRLSDHVDPGELQELSESLEPDGRPKAIFGRGPVWLAAFLAIGALPQPVSIFDIRYGWITVPQISRGGGPDLEIEITSVPIQANTLKIHFKIKEGVLDPREGFIFPLPEANLEGGVILSGKLPRWLFASLARFYCTHCAWLAVDDPGQNFRAVVVHSRVNGMRAGKTVVSPPTILPLK